MEQKGIQGNTMGINGIELIEWNRIESKWNRMEQNEIDWNSIN